MTYMHTHSLDLSFTHATINPEIFVLGILGKAVQIILSTCLPINASVSLTGF